MFIIHGIEQTSRETTDLILKISDLMMSYKHKIRDNYKFYNQDLLNNLYKHPYTKIEGLGRRGINAKKVVDHLYKRPVIDAENIRKITGLSSPSSYKLISDLENLDILKEITGSQRGRRYVFEHYLKLFR